MPLPLFAQSTRPAQSNRTTATPKLNIPYPWTPDQGDGTYRNPIICADYSDPDVVADGDDFYLVASSFSSTPGLPILHSPDLVNWTIINHAIQNLPDPRFSKVQRGQGVWAPAIRKHAGKFWIFFPTPDEGIYVTTADNPAGKWSEPKLILPGKGLIDPCPLWDDDGKAYLVHAYAKSRTGIKNVLRVRPMSADGLSMLGDGQVVFTDPEHQPTLEGPKFYKRNGYYYISAPAGGVEGGWQVILRSRNIYGPYEPKVVLAQGRTSVNGPHQGALVDLPSGETWFIHFQDAGVYGRITYLQPVRWENDWPLIGENQNANGVGQPVLRHAKPRVSMPVTIANPQTSDDFDASTLGLQWQWQANSQSDWYSLAARPGWLRLSAITGPDELEKLPNVLLQKLPASRFTVETRLQLTTNDPTISAGLILIGKTHAALILR